jgi:HAD superfamily hydrolase (TIGR01549 family)
VRVRQASRGRCPGRIAISAASDTRLLLPPVTVTTGVRPRRPQVRPFGGLSPWPDSSSKHSQAPSERVENTPDPLEVFICAAEISPELASRVEAEMTDLEVAAVATAKPTPYVHEVLVAGCRESGRTVGVVSNNSARAVSAYLDRHGLIGSVALVVARTSHDPALLKPSPHLLETAVDKLSADPAACTLVGDSLTDIEAAERAGVASIGYANKPGKREAMTGINAAAVPASLGRWSRRYAPTGTAREAAVDKTAYRKDRAERGGHLRERQ